VKKKAVWKAPKRPQGGKKGKKAFHWGTAAWTPPFHRGEWRKKQVEVGTSQGKKRGKCGLMSHLGEGIRFLRLHRAEGEQLKGIPHSNLEGR